MRRVDDDEIDAGLDESREAFAVFRTGRDRRADSKLLALVFRRLGVVAVLLEVRAGHERHQATLRVDDGQLALLRLPEDRVRLGESHPLRRGDELGDHHVAERAVAAGLEIDVAIGDDADQSAAERAVFRDGNPGEAHLGLDAVDVGDRVVGAEDHGVGDEAVLEKRFTLRISAIWSSGRLL